MNTSLIPTPDTIPVAWGWFQFLLMLTFPLHLLAMNAMLGSLGIGIVQHFKGGELREKLAHRIAIALPLVIAFAVNFGVAPLLFAQVLYGQFIYTSSVLMGFFWILVIPILIVAYYGAYLYDFRFDKLGAAGKWVAVFVFLLLICIGYFFSNNMLLMVLPEKFGAYFQHMDGTLLVSGHPTFLPRYFHMILGALAVGGLFVAILGRFNSAADPELADHAEAVGMRTFAFLTMVNMLFGVWFLLALPKDAMMLYMGKNTGATIFFMLGLVLSVLVIITAMKRKLWLTTGLTVVLIYAMAFMRAWLRSHYLKDVFTLDRLQLVPEYSPMALFLVTLVIGLGVLFWMLRKTVAACRS